MKFNIINNRRIGTFLLTTILLGSIPTFNMESFAEADDPCNAIDDNTNNIIDEGQVGVDDDTDITIDEDFEACLPFLISIFKFNDLNGNQVQDGEEPLLSGWEFTVTDGSDNPVCQGVTVDGPLVCEPVDPQVNPPPYTITETLQPGWVNTTLNPLVVNDFTFPVAFGNMQLPEEILKCYRTSGTINPPAVTLTDQFGTELFELGGMNLLCVEGLMHSDTPPFNPLHWKFYTLNSLGTINPPPVTLIDQFGEETVDPQVNGELIFGVLLGTPALKNGEGDLGAPHLKAYSTFEPGIINPPPVMVSDQFGTETVDPDGTVATFLLTPTIKTVDGDSFGTLDALHWKCYSAPGSIDPTEVTLIDQFGEETVDPNAAEFLCVMAEKLPVEVEDPCDNEDNNTNGKTDEGAIGIDDDLDGMVDEDFEGCPPELSEIHGIKWNDLDGDGVRDEDDPDTPEDESEPGVPNVQICANDFCTFTMEDDDLTPEDEAGMYWLIGLPSDDYIVFESVPDGTVQTFPPFGESYFVSLEPGQVVTGIDFGNARAGSIHGMKWNDENGDGIKDSGESGVPNVEICIFEIIPPDIFGEILNCTFTMEDNDLTPEEEAGMYWFMNLPPGFYRIEETTPSGKVQTFPPFGQPHFVELQVGQIIEDVNFGNQAASPGEIHGMKFNDQNSNGVKDGGESGVENVEICIFPQFLCDFTDADGNYAFTNLIAGDYTVWEFLPPGTTNTTPIFQSVTVPAGTVVENINFGNVTPTPPPPEVTVEGSFSDFNGIPTVFWGSDTTYTKDVTDHCEGNQPVQVKLVINFPETGGSFEQMMTNTSGEIWSATFGPFFPHHGTASLTFYVDCPPDTAGFPEDTSLIAGEDEIQQGGNIYVDPSGTIVDECTDELIEGATVTLLKESPPDSGNFVIPDTEDHIPETNPQTTGEDGGYGWVVVPGTYKVMAEKDGYVTGESDPLKIPPAVTDLEIALEREGGCVVSEISEESATGEGSVMFSTDLGGFVIGDFEAVSEDDLPEEGKPSDVAFPFGFFSWTITDLDPGDTVTITITFPSDIPEDTQYWKVIGGVWTDVSSLLGDNDGDNVLTLTIMDGGLGDADGMANGEISDPGGPGPLGCNSLPATIVGTDGNDSLTGTSGDDVIVGLEGNDKINGKGGNDTICGNEGNDRLTGGDGDDDLFGDDGNDQLKGDNGEDTLTGGDGNDTLNGGNDDDTLSGGDGKDKLYGNKGNDEMDGGDGNDLLSGDKGEDSLVGGAGNDTLTAGADDDTLEGDAGKDTLKGGTGDDDLDCGADKDVADGGAGDDDAAANCETVISATVE